MMSAEPLITPHDGGGLLGRYCAILFAGAVQLASSVVAFAGGDRQGLVFQSSKAVLSLTSPREAGKVPVVLIHGMLGRPDNWSVMIDRLTADPAIRERFQFLTFSYDSLQSIPESGRELLETLAQARRRFDPDGRDETFDRVVLLGHSLGGLVAKVATTLALEPQPAGSTGTPDERGSSVRLRIGRIIFIATPHRGVPVDRGIVRSVGTWLGRAVSPSNVAKQAGDDAGAPGSPTSVDQLSWDHPLLLDLERARATGGVPVHSIIAALGEPFAEGATDGLVPVASARLGYARSEFVVRSPHVCYQHPEVIREVDRILGEHAAEPARPLRRRPGSWSLAGSLGVLSIVPVPPGSRLVALRREAALPNREPSAETSRLIPPEDVPEYGTP
jgi:pimeloyl-ACP methyl ester carboxylesterase